MDRLGLSPNCATFRQKAMMSVCIRLMIFLGCSLLIWQCASDTTTSGEELAKIHCASCHQYPRPDLLDKQSWQQHILPRMGYMMGILPEDSIGANYIEPAARKIAFQNPNLFRPSSPLTQNEWRAIQRFYLQNAISEPLPVDYESTELTLPQFNIRKPPFQLSPPSTTLVHFSEDGFLTIGDAHTQQIYLLDANLQPFSTAKVREAPVIFNELDDAYAVTSMGSFSPTDAASGMILALPKNPQLQPKVLLDSLRRPVHTEFADLNQDGRFDLLICEFAKWTGSLSWWENRGGGQYEKHILRNMPGATKAYVQDMNGDERPDVVALFGQGDEGIFIFYNEGDGQFREERVLQFPPSYGSSYFQLFDVDDDGHLDILYTAGDNADMSPPPLKAYQGIRIFQNDGQNRFSESWFFPMPGAYKAIPADFDADGDVDMAAIAFFPDFTKQPAYSFVFLENQGDLQFKAYTFPQTNLGRWITMDAGDLDGDGDLDLALGALAFEVVPKVGLVEQWVQDGIPMLYLENTTY